MAAAVGGLPTRHGSAANPRSDSHARAAEDPQRDSAGLRRAGDLVGQALSLTRPRSVHGHHPWVGVPEGCRSPPGSGVTESPVSVPAAGHTFAIVVAELMGAVAVAALAPTPAGVPDQGT